jgi:hypothetical protein
MPFSLLFRNNYRKILKKNKQKITELKDLTKVTKKKLKINPSKPKP